MTNIQNIQNVSDCVPLYLPYSLYLKPIAKINISVALPTNKLGKSISNLDIMEKLSANLKPDKFLVLKVTKSTVEFIRFEAELDDRSRLRHCIARLDGVTFRVDGFSEQFRVRASEQKDDFPTRHDWDSFFRDARHMDEMKAGERPDTIHITHLPIRWFCPRHAEHEENVKPSESIFKRIFEKFGSIRYVDIPICDIYRNKMNSDINGMKTFSFEHDVLFEAYVQFDEYVGFVRAMDEFRGMKLVRKFVDKTQAINVTVNFDKSKHLSDVQMQRRERVRKRIINKAKAEDEELENQKKLEAEKLERERQKEEQLKLAELEKQREREEKRKEKHLKKIQERGQVEISQKIRIEERKMMIAQRKLESIRILEQLFDRIQLKHVEKQKATTSRKSYLIDKEQDKNDLRDRLVEKYKSATEKLLNEQRQKVEDIKKKTPILGLLNSKRKGSDSSDNDEAMNSDRKRNNNSKANSAGQVVVPPTADDGGLAMNPFKAVAALAAAGGQAAAAAGPYATEAANEWMKSLSMFPYVSSVFPPMSTSALYRPPPPFGVSMNYRGNAFAPRIRSRGRGRGRGRGGYDPTYSSSSSTYYSSHYKNYNYELDEKDEYRKSYSSRSGSHSRSRSRQRRSRSRRRSRSWNRRRSRGRSHSRSRSKSKGRRRSRSRSKSKGRSRRSRSRSRSKGQQRTNKKLVSTRRSRSSSSRSSESSRSSRSRSRSHRSWTRRGRDRRSSRRSSRSHSRSRSAESDGSARRGQVVIETDKLVRSAEEIKRTIEKDMQDRIQEETREIKANFNRRHRHSTHLHRHNEQPKLITATQSLQHNTSNNNNNNTTPKTAERSYSSEREQQKSDRSARSRNHSVDKDEVDAF